jgi:hypothetical protein
VFAVDASNAGTVRRPSVSTSSDSLLFLTDTNIRDRTIALPVVPDRIPVRTITVLAGVAAKAVRIFIGYRFATPMF